MATAISNRSFSARPLLVLCTALLALSEFYNCLKMVYGLNIKEIPVWLGRDPGLSLLLEMAMRFLWVWLLVMVLRRRRALGLADEKGTLLSVGLAAGALLLLSLLTVSTWLMGLKVSIAVMAWAKASEIFLLMMWSIAILFLLAGPIMRAEAKNTGRRWIFYLSFLGAILYFFLKGGVWYQLMGGDLSFLTADFMPYSLLLPLLLLLGRLALIYLLISCQSSDDRAAVT